MDIKQRTDEQISDIFHVGVSENGPISPNGPLLIVENYDQNRISSGLVAD